MVWYSQLGFSSNPLDSRPNPELVGLEEQEDELVNHIQKEEICFLNGPTGSGKSSLLYRVQKRLPNHKFVYLDSDDLPEDFDLEQELKKKRDFFDFITLRRFPRKNPVLLIDEFQATHPSLILKARSKWENEGKRAIRCIVIAQIEKHLANVSGSFKERLGKRTISLNVLDSKGLKDILRLRLYSRKKNINYANYFTEEALSMIVKCSDNNPRRLLEYADLIFDFHYRKFKKLNPILKGRDYKISHFVVKDILEDSNIKVDQFIWKDLRRKKLPFRKRFSSQEKRMLRVIFNSDSSTLKNIYERMEISPYRAQRILAKLKNKEAVVVAGREGRFKLWEVSPSIKRALIRK